MTVCAGFKSLYGIVVCTDSQETTSGAFKFDAPKVSIWPHDDKTNTRVRAIFAGAGHGPFIDKLVEKMWGAAMAGTDMSFKAIVERMEDANIRWHQKIWAAYENADKPQTEIIVALQADGELGLFKTTGPIFLDATDSAFVGIGGDLSLFLHDQIKSPFDSIEDDVRAALYILDVTKQYVDGCGGNTQLAVLLRDGSIRQMWPTCAEQLASGMREIAQHINWMFCDCRETRATRSEIDKRAMDTAREIHRIRAKIRKEVRDQIKVPKALERRLTVLYRKHHPLEKG